MSNVSKLLSAQTGDQCLIFYDKYSIDSLFGACILKYMCENITDISDYVLMLDVSRENEVYANTYKYVSYIGCRPGIEYCKNIIPGKLLCVTYDKDIYQYVMKNIKGMNVEYTDLECDSLHLWKVAFGEIRKFDILDMINAGCMHDFESDAYEQYLRLNTGYFAEYGIPDADQLYEELLYKVCCEDTEQDDIKAVFNNFITTGEVILNESIESLSMGLKTIKNKVYSIDRNKYSANVVFSAGELGDNFHDGRFDDVDFVLNIYRTGNYWCMDMYRMNDKIEFNCGEYLKKYYKGHGTESHGYLKLSEKVFNKLMTTESL